MTKWDGIALGIGLVTSLAFVFLSARREYKRSLLRDVDETC
jgi:hypothetical protein